MVRHQDVVVVLRLHLSHDADVRDLLHRLVKRPLQVLRLARCDAEAGAKKKQKEDRGRKTVINRFFERFPWTCCFKLFIKELVK